jgi:predicted transcriptional regulator
MIKTIFHPRAFLSTKRNVKLGLNARTQVIQVLEKRALNARYICQFTGLSYRIILHHLRLLEAENVVIRRGKKPLIWKLTNFGQQRLVNLNSY